MSAAVVVNTLTGRRNRHPNLGAAITEYRRIEGDLWNDPITRATGYGPSQEYEDQLKDECARRHGFVNHHHLEAEARKRTCAKWMHFGLFRDPFP